MCNLYAKRRLPKYGIGMILYNVDDRLAVITAHRIPPNA